MDTANQTVTAIARALSAPFDPSEIRWRPKVVSGNRALATPYLTARTIMDRLDAVVQPDGWTDSYQVLPDGSVVCSLRVRLGGEVVEKQDVGCPSEQTGAGDRTKSAFSDALKRAAVKSGIGRYLARVPAQWCDYDAKKRELVPRPVLPHWTLPAVPKSSDTVAAGTANRLAPQSQLGAAKNGKQARPERSTSSTTPRTGSELFKWLQASDRRVAAEGLCAKGALFHHVLTLGQAAGHGQRIVAWSSIAIKAAVGTAVHFEAECRGQNREVAAF